MKQLKEATEIRKKPGLNELVKESKQVRLFRDYQRR